MLKLNTHELEMIESSTPSLKLNLMRDYPSKEPVAVAICHHGITAALKFFDKLVKELNNANILVYRYDARGHGESEGKRGYLKTIFELVEDLRVVVNLAKKENPNLPIFIIGHSMGGHTCALFGTKYPNQVKGFVLCSAVLKDVAHLFGDLPLKDDPEKYYPLEEAFKAKEFDRSVTELIFKLVPNALGEISVSIMNCFGEGVNYLNTNIKNFNNSVLILNGNLDFIVDQRDAINYYMDSEVKDKSLMIYSGVGHMIWEEENGDMIPGHILNWIQHRIK